MLQNNLTGEHTCIMLRMLNDEDIAEKDDNWLQSYWIGIIYFKYDYYPIIVLSFPSLIFIPITFLTCFSFPFSFPSIFHILTYLLYLYSPFSSPSSVIL